MHEGGGRKEGRKDAWFKSGGRGEGKMVRRDDIKARGRRLVERWRKGVDDKDDDVEEDKGEEKERTKL